MNLYLGNAWHAVRRLREKGVGENVRVDVWVCSAGYGLIHADDLIRSYAATFGSGKKDSVAAGVEPDASLPFLQEWWEGLANWEGPGRSRPRCVRDLCKRDRKHPMLVAMSQRYLGVIEPDLLRGWEQMSDPNLLTIISAGTQRLNDLTSRLMPIDGRLRNVVGGSMHELNTRILGRVLERTSVEHLTTPKIRNRLTRWMNDAEPLEVFDRRPMSDEQVVAFIEKQLKRNPEARPTRLLRMLRESNWACEQKRFHRLFNSVEQCYGLW